MIIGWVSTGTPLHSTRLRPDEQYTHVTLWSIMAAPLLIGCDLTRLDDFTRSLLSNDEVLEIDQDELGQQGRRLLTEGKTEIWVKELADGGHAVAFFNRGLNRATISLPFASLNLNRPQLVRDLWRQQDLGVEKARFTATVAPHGTVFVKLTEASR
jgi:alpha-galactosidase